jgi:dipeptidase E
MRLYLSSFRTGRRADLLADLVLRTGRPPTVSVIANAIDEWELRRAEGVALELRQLSALGLDPVELDLRAYRTDPAALATRLEECAALWVRGGNVFVLRTAMARCGADRLLVDLLADDALVYAGYSAGACVLAPSLCGLETCDDADAVRRLYGADPVWDGLAVLDRAVVPHLGSPDHPETGLLGAVAAEYRRAGVPYWGLRDGQALVVDGCVEDAVIV